MHFRVDCFNMIKIQKLDKSRIEITGSIATDIFESYRRKALENINNEVTIDGFRKGKVPENILVSKVGIMTILEEMAELALSQAYPKIVTEEKIDAIGHPEIQITKIATGNPLEYKIITTVTPEVTLGDYKKISKEVVDKKAGVVEVTKKDIEDAILNIRRSRADHAGHDHSRLSPADHEKLVDASMPAYDEAFVKSLGNFKDIADFEEKIKEMISEEKKVKERDKRRVLISDKLIDTSTLEVPDLLIDSEVRRIEAQFGDDVARMGVKIEDYVKHAKKTIEDLRKEWRPHAEKKAKLQLILNKIADTEKIKVDPKEIETEVENIVEHYKDADREHAYVYAETVLMNEKVFGFLEDAK